MRIKVIETEGAVASGKRGKRQLNYDDLTFEVVIDDYTSRLAFSFDSREQDAHAFNAALIALVNQYFPDGAEVTFSG